jgi:hypothetical protein
MMAAPAPPPGETVRDHTSLRTTQRSILSADFSTTSMIEYDEIAEAKLDEEWKSWFAKVFDARDEIATFVAQHRQSQASGKPKFHRGSFNLCLQIAFLDGGPDAIIRFPRPGHSAFSEEKIMKEVGAVMILQRTPIPLPRLIRWGLTAESPQQLGPFIITEFVSGVLLSNFLRDPTEDDLTVHILDPNIDNEILDVINGQPADFMFELFQLDFQCIGAFSPKPDSKSTGSSKSSTNAWEIERPLTYTMNELVTLTGYPIDEFPTRLNQFKRATDFFESLATNQKVHLRTQRNIAYSARSARGFYIARHLFPRLLPK